MPLGQRILNLNVQLPSGTVTLDASMYLRVKIKKDALSIQNTCNVTCFNLSRSLRESLLSQFSAFNQRNVEAGQPGFAAAYINATVEAGYKTSSQSAVQTVYSGQVTVCEPEGGPPTLGVRIGLASQQIYKGQYITGPAPSRATFKQYVTWAAGQMGIPYVCETSYDNQVITNPSSQTLSVDSLLWDIQAYFRPKVAAWIDNNTLYVRDINKVVSTAQIVPISNFVGTPMWTEWGVEYQTFFNPQIQLAGGTILTSLLNPSLNRTFVTGGLEYDLTSRDDPFWVKVTGYPPA
ncbi:baseplate hub protein [Paraburkholderia phosphatilytica]|uniref:baseplate hub protein n=1 Tax=Paraburkholderia phosphatilytica TaxID=2282883 RepID=UPI000E493B6F|nr:hypothetical protein [Paraburkholderia phosphatilytica]